MFGSDCLNSFEMFSLFFYYQVKSNVKYFALLCDILMKKCSNKSNIRSFQGLETKKFWLVEYNQACFNINNNSMTLLENVEKTVG